MKKIDQFQITGMTISGFKSYQKRTDLIFGNPTIITGGNGQGKSSIADAIAFAITGLPFYGEHGLDRLHNEVNPDVFVQLRFMDGQGISHELTRTRQKSRTTIVLDGYEIRQMDLSDIFGERDVFLSIFNPLYFIEELGESGKNLLSRYLPAIHQKDILAQLSEPVRERLEKEDILSPDAFLKAKREEIRQLAENIIYLNGQRDQALTQNQIRKEKLASIPQRHDALKTELSALETKRFAGMDIPAVKERLAELTTQYSESRIDCQNDAQQMQVQLNALREKIAARQAEPYQPKYTEALAEAQTKLGVLAAQYNWEGQTFQSLAAGKDCPVCHRPVTEAMLPEIQDKVKRTAAALLADGQKMQQHIQKITALEQKSQDAFNQFRADDLLKLKSEMDAISDQCRKLDNEAAAQAADLRAQIQSLDMDLEYGTLTQAEYERLQQCREECQQCEAELNALRSLTDQDLTVFDRQIEQTEKDINELKKLIADVPIYAGKFAEMMFSALKLNRMEISLYNVVKSTGELKDTFKFNYNGRRYDRLSLSEKIRAGMEVSQLVMRLTERKYPVFIDNMESVDDLENVRPVSQIIFSKCVSKTPLQVRPVQPIQTAMPAAA